MFQVLLKVGVSMQEGEEGRRAWTVVHHAAFHGRLGIMQVILAVRSIRQSRDFIHTSCFCPKYIQHKCIVQCAKPNHVGVNKI